MAATSVRVWAGDQMPHPEHNETRRPRRLGEAARASSEKPPLPRKPNGLIVPQTRMPPIELSSVSPYRIALSPRIQECVTTVFSFDDMACRRSIEAVWPQQCAYIVMEIIHTERVYVQALADVIKVSYSVFCPWLIVCYTTYRARMSSENAHKLLCGWFNTRR